MRYLLYAILVGSAASGALVMTTMAAAPHQTAPAPPSSPPPAQNPSPPATPGSEQTPEGSQEEELEPFTPSERVPADSAVSFPVDI